MPVAAGGEAVGADRVTRPSAAASRTANSRQCAECHSSRRNGGRERTMPRLGRGAGVERGVGQRDEAHGGVEQPAVVARRRQRALVEDARCTLRSSWRSQPRASGIRGATRAASQWRAVNGISMRSAGAGTCRRARRAAARSRRLVSPGRRRRRSSRAPRGYTVHQASGRTASASSRRRSGASTSTASGPASSAPSRAALPPTGRRDREGRDKQRARRAPRRSAAGRAAPTASASGGRGERRARSSRPRTARCRLRGRRRSRAAAVAAALAPVASQAPGSVRALAASTRRRCRQREEQRGDRAAGGGGDAERGRRHAAARTPPRARPRWRTRSPSTNGIRPLIVAAPSAAANQTAAAAAAGRPRTRRAKRGRRREQRQGADEADAEPAAERREQHAVAGHVVPAVPAVVPEREARAVEQAGAVGLRGEVRRRRSGRQVDGADRSGEQECRHRRRRLRGRGAQLAGEVRGDDAGPRSLGLRRRRSG